MSEDERELFLQAIELPTPERRAFLASRLPPDSDRLRDLLGLLDAHERATPEFLDLNDVVDASAISVPGYEIRGLLGQGAFGTVFLAQELGQIEREVALKVLRVVDARAFQRFQAERQYLANLQHPCIAPIFAAGQTKDHRPFFAMERIHGVAITLHADACRWGIDRRLQAFLDVCDGVAYAHRRGVMHADLKPSNILVSEHDDRPHIIDFGVARTLADHGPEAVAQRSLAGTPSYMSPELARGHAVDTRSDVYSLGVLLYELLTGTVPSAAISGDRSEYLAALSTTAARHGSLLYESGSPLTYDRRTALAEARAATPRGLRKRLSGDLDAILAKALRLDPDDRYASVDAFREDLERHVARLPVLARARSMRYVLRQAVLRHRFSLGAALMGLLLVGVGWFAWQRVGEAEADAALSAQAAVEWSRSASDIADFFVATFDGVGDVRSVGGHATATDIVRSAASRIDERFANAPYVEARLRNLIGSTFERINMPLEARRQFLRLIEIYDGMPDGGGVCDAWRARLRAAKSMLGREAEGQVQRLVDDLRGRAERLGDRLSAVDFTQLERLCGLLALSRGDLPSAIACGRAAMTHANLCGADAPVFVYEACQLLARALVRSGDVDEAQRVLADAEVAGVPKFVLGPIDQEVSVEALRPSSERGLAAARDDFARICAAHGRYSLPAQSAAAVLGAELLGKGHNEDAEALMREHHSWALGRYGCGHPRLAAVLRDVAVCVLARGAYDQAAKLLAEAERLGEQVQDPAFHVRLAMAQGQLAAGQGRSEDALSLFDHAYREQVEASGVESSRSRMLQEARARQFVALGRYEDAADLYDELVRLELRLGSGDSRRLAGLQYRAGLLAGQVGRFESAGVALSGAYDQASALPDDQGVRIALEAAESMAELQAILGEEEQAVRWRGRRDACRKRLEEKSR